MINNKILINEKEIKIADEFIKLKKEELAYIDNIAKISRNKTLSEYEKLEIHRTLNNFKNKLTDLSKKLFNELIKRKEQLSNNYDDSIIEFDIDKSFLSSLKFKYEEQEKYVLNGLGINENNLTFKLTLKDLIWIYNRYEYNGINSEAIQNKQRLIEYPIYIFCGIYDASEDCYGPCFGERDSYLYGIYKNIRNNSYNNEEKDVPKKNINEFEKDKIIIHSKRYVHSNEIRKIFEEELLNSENKTINDCVTQTRNRIEELNYTRSPEYKEKVLLDRIKELNKKNEKEFIKKEILYSDELDIAKEKNNTKNSVIIIGITQDKEYIITSQKKIKNKLTAGFPSGHTKDNEDVIESAKRLLKEKIGYISDDLFIVDEAYSHSGLNNSVTYIVVANNCIKTNEEKTNNNYALFKENELEYLINKNIMNDAIDKLAYYNLICNTDDCNVIYTKNNKKIYKKLKQKTNPLDN